MSRLSVVRPQRSAALVLALALAVWLAATLGLVHRTVHVPGLPAASSQANGHAQSHAHPHTHAFGGIVSLFDAHASGDVDCRLYDQLAQGAGAPSVPLLVLPMLLPAATFAWLDGEFLARWVALFDARGPPPSR